MRIRVISGRTRPCPRGFTLIEVMIVLVIVGILAAVAYPTYKEAVRRGNRAEGRAALMELMQQEERYYSRNNRYIAFSGESTDKDAQTFNWFSGDSAASSAYEISAAACAGETIENCVQLTAIPGGPNVDTGFSDPVCGNLTFTSTGEKGANDDDCWN